MLRDQKVTAIIPARGGSKGIPGKNLYKIGKDSLLERTIKIGLLCKYIDKVLVSTDDVEMYKISCEYNVNTPELRSAELASDNAKTIDVVKDVLLKDNIIDGFILLLQPTSATRTLGDLNLFCRNFESSSKKYDSSVSLVSFDSPHPNKIQIINEECVKSYMGTESMISRQLLPKVYALNGAFYLTSLNFIYDKNSFFGNFTLPFIMDEMKSINLDSKLDLYLLESLIDRKIISIEEYEV